MSKWIKSNEILAVQIIFASAWLNDIAKSWESKTPPHLYYFQFIK